MSWPYSAAKVHELVRAPKCPAPDQQIAFTAQGEHGKELSHNRHDPLPDFTATDLQDFLRRVCDRWNIHVDFAQDLW